MGMGIHTELEYGNGNTHSDGTRVWEPTQSWNMGIGIHTVLEHGNGNTHITGTWELEYTHYWNMGMGIFRENRGGIHCINRLNNFSLRESICTIIYQFV